VKPIGIYGYYQDFKDYQVSCNDIFDELLHIPVDFPERYGRGIEFKKIVYLQHPSSWVRDLLESRVR